MPVVEPPEDPALPLPTSRPQHLLITLLGDYWYGRRERLPSAALVELLAEFGVTAVGARGALSRLSRRELLDSERVGRRTYYGLTQKAVDMIVDGSRRILSFGADASAWDGHWTVAAFSVPEHQRDLRHALRSQLRWLGLAPLYDGVWVTHRPVAADVAAILAELDVPAATVFTATAGPGGRNPIEAWNLDGLRGDYENLIDRFRPLVERARGGRVGAAEALVARTVLMDAWRNLPNLDPELPADLLPERWPRETGRALFVELYDGLAPLAQTRVRQIVARHDAALARLVRAHDSRAD